MSVQIRPIEGADKAAWDSLWDQYNQFYKRTIPANVTITTFSRFLDEKYRMYCVVAVDSESNDVVGFATYYPHQSTSTIDEVAYLHDLFVEHGARNKGAGRQLIERVYREAKTLGCDSVYWHTQYFNHRAQLLYTKVANRTDFVQYQKNF
ncbi:D-amino-acid N-acetyltransferase [Knufia obscura]|uniref:D-amino-acid N-acetyltransferase n=1 Tax=Knufia obscura TaxID=1635080 RepID=A0ABR0R8P1_9EURO|nr:D-amino-acid N-acetyltransferase [Knufia obscura]